MGRLPQSVSLLYHLFYLQSAGGWRQVAPPAQSAPSPPRPASPLCRRPAPLLLVTLTRPPRGLGSQLLGNRGGAQDLRLLNGTAALADRLAALLAAEGVLVATSHNVSAIALEGSGDSVAVTYSIPSGRSAPPPPPFTHNLTPPPRQPPPGGFGVRNGVGVVSLVRWRCSDTTIDAGHCVVAMSTPDAGRLRYLGGADGGPFPTERLRLMQVRCRWQQHRSSAG